MIEINGIECDTFVHVDKKNSGDTLVYSLDNGFAGNETNTFYVCLLSNNELYSIDSEQEVFIYIQDIASTNSVVYFREMHVENDGSLRLNCSSSSRWYKSESEYVKTENLFLPNKTFLCEIVVKGKDSYDNDIIIRSSNFRLTVIE